VAHWGPLCRRRSAGFTLVELLVVTALVATLAALAVPSYLGIRRVAYNSAALRDLTSLRTAVLGDVAVLPASGTITAVGPAAFSIAKNVRVSRNVTLRLRKTGTTTYTITASHSLGSATYTTDQTGRITATGAKI
jgi:prepilin-type N-terminal cleavage/methylation domain-containing protein